jgi:DNA polymerase III delta subunit
MSTEADLKKALAYQVVLISGPEEALRGEALQAFIAHATSDDDFDLEGFEAGASDPKQWLASAGTAPFLADRRTVVVRHLLRAGDPEEIFGKEPKIELPPTAWLILVCDDEQGDDSKQKRLERTRGAWEKFIAGQRGLVLHYKADKDLLKKVVKERLAGEKKSITPGALNLLSDMCGESLSRAVGEAEKLILYVGDEKQIGESDVKAAVLPSREWQLYGLVDAIFSGAVGAALTQLKVLMGSAAKAEEYAYRDIFPTISRQLKYVWQARICVDAKCLPSTAPDHIRRLFPSKNSITSLKDYPLKKSMARARQISLEQIARCMQVLSDADARLKGMLPGFSTAETLEHLVLEMVDIVRPAPVAAP